ncbi:PREDICTED: EP300-interacting inhibitor of differentiation 1-like [Chrysochloris asiatica]|uniref:EP300-interacting inhibitor of differentiation 1-like n=1 Tax=Chrysochloris asiatica TaxID=185453 RepID=A0A9B0WPR5_CHRAS|nr:PREDICTED: EP300-interacting inhibitor of differentiation 1-like [Chrysochloris asiatica]
MSEMSELSKLYEESNDLQMDVMAGESDLPQKEVGSGNREPSLSPSRLGDPPQLEKEGPMEEEAQPMAAAGGQANRPRHGEQPGQVSAPGLESKEEGEEFDDYDYPEEEHVSGAGYRVSAALEEANKMFLRTPRAREAALDGGFQMHYEKTPFDQLALIEELFSLVVVNRLTEELACDEIIDQE